MDARNPAVPSLAAPWVPEIYLLYHRGTAPVVAPLIRWATHPSELPAKDSPAHVEVAIRYRTYVHIVGAVVPTVQSRLLDPAGKEWRAILAGTDGDLLCPAVLLSLPNPRKAAEFARHQVGKPYDFWGIFLDLLQWNTKKLMGKLLASHQSEIVFEDHSRRAWTCSRLALGVALRGGGHWRRVGRPVAPVDLYVSPIYGNPKFLKETKP